MTNTLPSSFRPPGASLIHRVSLADGTAQRAADLDYPAVLISRTDGWMALRDARHDPRAEHPVLVLDPQGTAVGQLQTSAYDLFNHNFDIRNAPALLLLIGDQPHPWRHKWVAVLDEADMAVRRLFPLEWDTARDGQLFGGPGVFLNEAADQTIVHAAALHDGAGLLPGNSFIIARHYPTGDLRWEHRLNNQVAGVDACHGRIFAVTNCGELLMLRADNGSLLAQHDLTLNGHPVVALSLRATDPQHLYVGTHDGRILDIDLL